MVGRLRNKEESQDTPCSIVVPDTRTVGRLEVLSSREKERGYIYDTGRPMALPRTADPTMDHSTRGWTIPMLTAFHAKCREPRSALSTYGGTFRSLLVIPWAGYPAYYPLLPLLFLSLPMKSYSSAATPDSCERDNWSWRKIEMWDPGGGIGIGNRFDRWYLAIRDWIMTRWLKDKRLN